MRPQNGNSSHIKFGSWDESGKRPGSNFKAFRTKTPYRWSVLADDYSVAGAKFLTNQDRELQFSPHLPYMYIPS